jgi:hypothetical protein
MPMRIFLFFQKYMTEFQNLQNYTTTAPYHRCRLGPNTIPYTVFQLPCSTAFVNTSNRRTTRRKGSIRFQKTVTFFYELGWTQIYIKIVSFDEMYNFVVHFFSFELSLRTEKIIYYPDLDTEKSS